METNVTTQRDESKLEDLRLHTISARLFVLAFAGAILSGVLSFFPAVSIVHDIVGIIAMVSMVGALSISDYRHHPKKGWATAVVKTTALGIIGIGSVLAFAYLA